MIAAPANLDAHTLMSPPGSHDDAPPARPSATDATPDGPQRPEEQTAPADTAPGKRRNPWIWVSALLALAVVGLLIWALTSQSDLDSTQSELDSTQQELASTKQTLDSTTQKLDSTTKELDSTTQDFEELQSSQAEQGNATRRTMLTVGALATVNALYDDLADQLGATEEDLAAIEKDLANANEKAAQAEQDAAAAEQKAAQADNETDKAKAQAEQANAEAQAAQSKAAVAADCAKAYISAFGILFEGDSVRAQAPAVRDEFASITADCKSALAGS